MSLKTPKRVTDIVPIEPVEASEELLDQQDGAVAQQRLEEIRSGDAEVVPAEDLAEKLGL